MTTVFLRKSILASVILALPLLAPTVCAGLAQDTGFSYHEGRNLLVYGGVAYTLSHMDNRNPTSPERRQLYLKNIATGAEQLLFEADADVTNLRFAPSGEVISFIEHHVTENVPAEEANYVSGVPDEQGVVHRIYRFINPTLVLISLEGTVLAKLNFVYRYAWNPAGSQLAHLTGRYHEGGLGFLSTGLWIYDLGQRQATKVAPTGYDLYWSRHDGALYVYNLNAPSPVGRYDPAAGAVLPTLLKGSRLSPDGRHYFPLTFETEFRIFSLPGHQDSTRRHPIFQEYKFIDPVWSPDGQALVFRNPNPLSSDKLIIYNLASRTVKEVAGTFAGFAANRRQVVLVAPHSRELHFEPW